MALLSLWGRCAASLMPLACKGFILYSLGPAASSESTFLGAPALGAATSLLKANLHTGGQAEGHPIEVVCKFHASSLHQVCLTLLNLLL